MTHQEPTSSDEGKLIDISTGKPFSSPELKKSRWKAIPTKIKMAAILLGAFIAFSATFIENLEKITAYFKDESIPFIVVKITNSGRDIETVYGRGDFIIWLPGPDISRLSGKYEFFSIKRKNIDKITIKPKETVTVLAKVINESIFSKIFSHGDCDLSLILFREKKHIVFTENIPFSENAIKKYYLEVDAGKK